MRFDRLCLLVSMVCGPAGGSRDGAFKLTHRDMDPIQRYLGPLVPKPPDPVDAASAPLRATGAVVQISLRGLERESMKDVDHREMLLVQTRVTLKWMRLRTSVEWRERRLREQWAEACRLARRRRPIPIPDAVKKRARRKAA